MIFLSYFIAEDLINWMKFPLPDIVYKTYKRVSLFDKIHIFLRYFKIKYGLFPGNFLTLYRIFRDEKFL